MILRTTLTENNAENEGKRQSGQASGSAINIDYIIAECMDQLIEWLREEKER